MDKAQALAELRRNNTPVAPGQKLTVRPFEPGDALGVARLFLDVYGEDYPIDDAYIPERIIAAHAEDRLRTALAVAEDGSIIGQVAFFKSSPPNPGMFEYGQVLVHHEYRNSMAVGRMFRYATNEMAGKDGMAAFFGEAVCNHLATQKMSRGMVTFGCAMELGLMPAEAYAREGAVGRVSCLLMARVDSDRRQPRFVPGCWAELLGVALAGFSGLERDQAPAATALPPDGESRLDVRHFAYAGVTRVNAFRAGADFAARLAAITAEATERGDALVQVMLGLDSPPCGGAAEALRRAGYFCAGALPCWFAPGDGGDALLAQRFLKPVELAHIRLLNEEVEALCAAVRADMERAAREFGAPLPVQLPEPA